MAMHNIFKTEICLLAAGIALVMLSSSCASTSVKSTWKSPDYKGELPKKIAVVADEERMMVRVALENRFVNQLDADGQPAFGTASSFADLEAARKNKEASLVQLRAAGADAILITRLVSKSAYLAKAQQRFTGQYVAMTVTPDSDGWDASIGSYSAYSGGPRSDDRSYLFLETSLFDLNTGKRIWACLTETTVKETDDRLEIADEFVAKVVGVMHQDGMIR
jgi:hypothetical protein